MIGSYDGLFNASQGRMAPRVVSPPPPPATDINDAWARRNALASSAAAGAPTSLYNTVISGANRATGGLSAKGKYGGFFSAGDQQAAIEGSAINLRETLPQTLLAKSQAFYNKLDPMYGKASLGAQQTVRGSMGFNPKSSSAASFRQFEETSQNRTAPLRTYAANLNDWYSKQSKPAEQYVATAAQIQATPLSELATRIATSAYGMNPDLAMGKFRGLDKTYATEQEEAAQRAADQQEAAALGIPAAQLKSYKAAEAANAKTTAGIPKQYQGLVENTTRFKASDLESATNQTSEQLYSSFASQFDFTDPDTNKPTVANGAGVISKLREYIDSGDAKSANNLITNIAASQSQGQQQLVRILTAMFKLGISNTAKQTDDNSQYIGK